MMIVNYTAVRADRNVDAGFLVIPVSFLAYLDKRCSLTASDTLGLTGDAYRSAADTDLDEIGTALC